MHDSRTDSRSATAARRFPGRTTAGVGAVLVVALSVAWGVTTTRSEPAAHADSATADQEPGGGGATAEGAREVTLRTAVSSPLSTPATQPSDGWTNGC